jgi:hypothetical protein
MLEFGFLYSTTIPAKEPSLKNLRKSTVQQMMSDVVRPLDFLRFFEG